MNTPPDPATTPVVLIVHDDATFAEALSLTLERLNVVPAQIQRAADARLVVQGAPALMAVISRCTLSVPSEQPLLAWVAEHRPHTALMAICSNPGHNHEELPAHATVLRAPYDATDLRRALAEARLAAFEGGADQ